MIPIEFPLKHPKKIFWNDKFDDLQGKQLYSKSTLWLELITKRLKPLISKFANR